MTEPVQTVDLIASAASVVTLDRDYTVHSPGALAVAGERIVAVGPPDELTQRYRATRRLDAPDCFIFPGLINTHTHLWQTLLKGLGDEMPLMEWIERLLLPTLPHLDAEACYLAAALGALEAARCGCTTTLDFMHGHADPNVYDAVIRAFEDIGGNLVLGRGLRDRTAESSTSPLEATLAEQLDDCRRLFETYGRERVWLAPSTVWAMTEAGLRSVRTLADELGMLITIHMNEVKFDSAESLRRFNQRSLPYLDSLGFLKPDVLHAHGVWLDDWDLELLARNGCAVSYAPISNMYLGSGTPRILDLQAAGIRLSLATDGAASNNGQDLIEALKFGALLQKVTHCDPTALSAPAILRLATLGGGDALHRPDLGQIAPSSRADFFVFDPRHPKSIPVHDPVSTLVYAGGEHNIVTTVAAGRVVLENGRFPGIDERAILAQAQEMAAHLARTAGTDGLVRGRPAARLDQRA
jgi:5-methylthioadenosine/S-adenosylhomocysteine deaminase